MSGLLLAQRLRAEPATQDAVLIAVTAFNGPQAQRVALEAGFVAYVRKPIDPLSFAQLVQAHVGEEK
jgi:CheY-like chemotaxis protein